MTGAGVAYTLRQLAEQVAATLAGDPHCEVRGVNTLQEAGPGDISFLANPRYVRHLPATRASAVILSKAHSAKCPAHALVVQDPYLAYARIACLFHPGPVLAEQCIAPSASVGEGCVLDEPVQIGHGAHIGARTRIGAGCHIGAGCVIGEDVSLGPGCRLDAGVYLHSRVRLGARVVVQSATVIGSNGFGMAWTGQDWLKIPQVGTVVVGDDVEIGANTTIDRGALGDTVIGAGVKIDSQVQIAHNVHIGEHTAIAGCTGVAGSTRVGRRCRVGGSVSIAGHLEVADDVVILGMSGVARSIAKPGVYASGLPAMEAPVWRRAVLRLPQLDDMAKTLRELSGGKPLRRADS